MSLLHEIQEAIIDPSSKLGPILLKLRLLANRLGSEVLEEWVRYESEGYPKNVKVPDYRRVAVAYSGNFQNIAWKASNQPIPSYLILKFCGEEWLTQEMRESIAAIDALVSSVKDGGYIGTDCTNLILTLQGKVYPDMNCTSISGKISTTAVQEIQNQTRTKILELTMKLEKEIPNSADISIGKPIANADGMADKIEQVFNMTVHGSNTMINSTGSNANIIINNEQGDINGVEEILKKSGIPSEEAKEFSTIIQSEKPESNDRPYGQKASDWLAQKLPKIAQGAWNISLSVATHVLEEAAKRYYGLE